MPSSAQNNHLKSSTTQQSILTGFVLDSPSEDGPGIMYKMHIMSPQLQKRKLHQGITENTLAEAS
jgi:hypothetical protein